MNDDRIARLEAMGFQWDRREYPSREPRNHAWDKRPAEIQARKAENGHYAVPATYKVSVETTSRPRCLTFLIPTVLRQTTLQENQKPGNWVNTQRTMGKALKNGQETGMNEETMVGVSNTLCPSLKSAGGALTLRPHDSVDDKTPHLSGPAPTDLNSFNWEPPQCEAEAAK
jgi:hypothetical protein